jgi:hypothetical protein
MKIYSRGIMSALLPHFSVAQCTFFILEFCVHIGPQRTRLLQLKIRNMLTEGRNGQKCQPSGLPLSCIAMGTDPQTRFQGLCASLTLFVRYHCRNVTEKHRGSQPPPQTAWSHSQQPRSRLFPLLLTSYCYEKVVTERWTAKPQFARGLCDCQLNDKRNPLRRTP